MALDALRIALQGLYQLTPIALAVQGLIETYHDEAEPLHYFGGGGRRRGGRVVPRPAQRQAPVASRADPLTEEHVRAQWDLLELRQAQFERHQPRRVQQPPAVAAPLPAEPRAAPVVAAAPVPAPAAVVQPPAPAAAEVLPGEPDLRNDDALALLLLLHA